jgi:hypothetical protein
MPGLEIFTPTGVVAGTTLRDDLVQSPDLRSPVPIEQARWYPIDGASPEHRGSLLVPPDDVLIVVTLDANTIVHSTWYPLELDVGPYRVRGRMPVVPGFDPARALARPGGAFVALWDASIELLDRPETGVAHRDSVHVNRYAVERVESSIMLGFFFPGAELGMPNVAGIDGAEDDRRPMRTTASMTANAGAGTTSS